ncbi:MAG: flagellar hook assembly protein FlgD [Xanthomonadaceae bacterium]|nr:flagellar hook assembly protein FlgD [Xanthomonadaceae bacterium]
MTAVYNNSHATGVTPNTSGADAPMRAVSLSEASELENNFLTLLVAQIQNQDPTNPVDSTEYLQQYATMSQVRSMENMALLAQSNLVLLDNLQTLTAANLVGQNVTVTASAVDLGSEKVSGQVKLQHPAAKTVLYLTDALGKRVEVQLGPQAAGTVSFTVDPVALGLAPGRYEIAVESDIGERPRVELTGQVRRVRVSAEGPVLDVAGVGAVPFYNIVEFGRADGGTDAFARYF